MSQTNLEKAQIILRTVVDYTIKQDTETCKRLLEDASFLTKGMNFKDREKIIPEIVDKRLKIYEITGT